jgi:transmembrane sensor
MSLLARIKRPPSASGWFALVRSGRITKGEDRRFLAWLRQNALHEHEYENNELAFGLSLDLAERPIVSRLIEQAVRDVEAPREHRPVELWRRRPLIAVAATLVLALAAGVYLQMNRTSGADYGTQIGEQKVVKLEDGSTLTLNTATELHVQYSRKERNIELARGEALFAVTPDASRPFRVLALGSLTTAVGTEFVVALHGSEAEVSVLGGVVSVGSPSPEAPAAIRISAGQAVNYGPNGALGTVHEADAERIRAWQANRMLFSNKRLADAIEEYNRYSTKPLILEAPELADRRVHGIFKVGDEEAFIHALERGLPLRAKRGPDTITLVPR